MHLNTRLFGFEYDQYQPLNTKAVLDSICSIKYQPRPEYTPCPLNKDTDSKCIKLASRRLNAQTSQNLNEKEEP